MLHGTPTQPRTARLAAPAATTSDALFHGRVTLVQPAKRHGYRVNVDALLLATFAARSEGEGEAHVGAPARAAFDLGSGVGAVGLSLLHLGAASHVTMIEVDRALADLASANARANEWQDRIDVVHADVREAARTRPGAADLVVCNPPYVAPGRGRVPDAVRARAKCGDLGIFLDAARTLAGRRARICFVYPAIEATTLLVEMRARGLEPKRLRAVHGKADAPARVLLVECRAAKPGGLVVEPPLVEVGFAARGAAR